MPLHPVPIIIGTTLAVIGSGYAFKKVRCHHHHSSRSFLLPIFLVLIRSLSCAARAKAASSQFIYDPHLAPLIEAIIANHRQSLPSSPVARHHPVPVPVRSSASTTARRDHHTHLRRRSHRSSASRDHELREGTLDKRETVEDGGVSVYERRELGLMEDVSVQQDIPLIDLEFEEVVPERTEVESLIFVYSSTPLFSGPSSPARGHHAPDPLSPSESRPASEMFNPDDNVNPFINPISPVSADRSENGETLATMSFLSLSPVSSPSQPRTRLPSLDQWAEADETEDDLLSLPETSMSTSEDAETSASSSRGRQHSSPEMSHVQLMMPSSSGPGSVVSLSESEGESEWEAVGH